MTAPPKITNIDSRVIVSCAGSGKTRKLIKRLLCLLRGGAKPGEILAITFTNKAAGEIRERLLAEMERLSKCEAKREPAIAECYKRVLLADDPEYVFTAHTFHSWFLTLLQNRPWTRGGAGAPALAADTASAFDESWRRWRRRAERNLPEELKTVLAELSPYSLRELCESFKNNRNACLLRGAPPPVLDFAAAEKMQRESLRDAAKEFAKHARGDGKTFARAFDSARRLAADARAEDERPCFLTLKEEPLKALQKNSIKRGYAPLLENINAEWETLLLLQDEMRAEKFNAAALSVCKSFDDEWRAVLDSRHEMTFDDLELRALEMLQDEHARKMLSHRLYLRYRHVLIDEFQDTSPLQWQIVRRWLWDAHGTDDSPSVFIVGDPKQAIYGFRRGDSRLLGEANNFLQEYYGVKKQKPLNICFRCAENIIAAVNETFDGEINGEEKLPDFVRHAHYQKNTAGRVEWHSYSAERKPAQKPRTRNPLTERRAAGENAPEIRAAAVADKTKEILNGWKIKGKNGETRRCRPEDILILMPQTTHAAAQTDALAARNIACAADKKSAVADSFACADVLDLIAVLLAPRRDYALARALKSPLFALDDNALSALAAGAKTSLWDNLQADNSPPLRRARVLLKFWRRRAEKTLLPAHDFLSRIFAQGNFIARCQAAAPSSLQRQVGESLSRFLDLSLQMDGGARPLLAQFWEEARRRNWETPPAAAGGVRLMSVHAAKGLQSPVVILADADFSQKGGLGDPFDILMDWPPGENAPARFAVSLRRYRRAFLELKNNAEKTKERERANLLYVAMTRAQQALIIFSPAEPKDVAVWARDAMQKLSPEKNAPGAFIFGEDLRGGECADAPPPAKPAAIIPAGKRNARNAEMARGEIRHTILALLLSGVPPAQAKRLAAAEPAQWEEAEKIAAALPLKKLLQNAREILTEREFAVDKKIVRPDLVVVGEKTAWIVDFKTAAAPERHRAQLESYRRAIAARYPKHETRLAILDIRGEMHFLD